MGRSGGVGKTSLLVLVAALVVVSCGQSSSTSRTKNAALVTGTGCSRPGQVSKVVKAPVVCASTSAGNVWYSTMPARGRSVSCAEPGKVRKKKGVVWVCGVDKKNKSWRATAPLPAAVTQASDRSALELQSTDGGTASSPMIADGNVLANPAIPDETTTSTVLQSRPLTVRPTVPEATVPATSAMPTTVESVVPEATVPATSTTTTTLVELPTPFRNRTTTDGLGNNFVFGAFALGSTVYAATNGGLSVSVDGGATFTNRTTTDGLGNNSIRGVSVSFKVYGATESGLSISN